jgi:hypothetical protein
MPRDLVRLARVHILNNIDFAIVGPVFVGSPVRGPRTAPIGCFRDVKNEETLVEPGLRRYAYTIAKVSGGLEIPEPIEKSAGKVEKVYGRIPLS